MKKLLFILIIMFLFISGCGIEKKVAYGKELTISNKLYNLTFSVVDVEKKVNYEATDSILSRFGLNGTYTKVKVSIKNNSNKEAIINYILFPISILDSSNNKISVCNYGANALDERLKDEKLIDTIPANKTISGYVYCKDEDSKGEVLKINVPYEIISNENGQLVNSNEYIFKLS